MRVRDRTYADNSSLNGSSAALQSPPAWVQTIHAKCALIESLSCAIPHISKFDLDLLVHLAVLLEERHVTRAAERCFLSQSAMSRQLEHLREALGDELLLRNGRSHERTARGDQLLRELETLLPRIILRTRSACCPSGRRETRSAPSIH